MATNGRFIRITPVIGVGGERQKTGRLWDHHLRDTQISPIVSQMPKGMAWIATHPRL